MRAIVNISMPETMRHFLLKRCDEGGYGSVSEYIRHLIRQDQEVYMRTTGRHVERERPLFKETPLPRAKLASAARR